MANSTLSNRHETLFLWDVRKSNPNGDPNGNEPRIDRHTKKCDVTDVCIKRSVRNYMAVKDGIDSLLVTKLGEDSSQTVTLNERIASYLFNSNKLAGTLKLIKEVINGRLNIDKDSYKTFLGKPLSENLKKLLDEMGDKKTKDMVIGDVSAEIILKDIIDALRAHLCGIFKDLRMFGSVLALKGNLEILGGPLTGPVQIEVGTSLHRVVQSNKQITSVMGSKEEKEAGIIGDTHCIEYGLFATSAIANENAARFTGLTDTDHGEFLKALWRGIRDRHTRSKNQVPRLLIDIEYNKPFHFGDLVNSVKLNPVERNGRPLEEEAYRSIDDFTLALACFYKKVNTREAIINSIEFASNGLITMEQFRQELNANLKNKVTEVTDIDFD